MNGRAKDFQVMRYAYPCTLHPEQPEGFYVTFPDVPGALTSGKDRAEALEMAEDALAIMLVAYVEQRKDIPVPSEPTEGEELVSVPPIIAAKLELRHGSSVSGDLERTGQNV